MQNQRRENEQDLRRFLYPREIERSPARKISNNTEYLSKKPKLHYQYDDQQSVSSYILNKEMNLNAQGYPRDEVHFSVLDNNNKHFSHLNRTYKPEGKIYHYSIASRKDYSRDKNDEYNTYYYPEKRAKRYYIEKKIPVVEKEYLSNYGRQEENILPTKVYISDSFGYNKSGTYKFRPSREKDGYNEYKGGIVNLRRKKYTSNYEINSIILIQRWWRSLINIIRRRRRNERYENEQNEYYPSYASRKTYSRGNERIVEKIIPGENDKFIIQTTKVEVYRNPYMNIPLLKPEIITKEVKLNSSPKKNNIEINNDYEIFLDKESLKQNMRNIWNEECISSSVDCLSILQRGNMEEMGEMINKNILIKYEEEIKQLKIALSEKENKLIEFSNKLKTLSSNKEMEIEENYYFKEEETSLRKIYRPFKNNLKIQLVDRLLIRNSLNLEGYNKLYAKPKSQYLIENNYNICIFPIEKEPLKKQLIDDLFIDGSGKENLSAYRGKKINEFRFSPNKMIIEPKDNLEILPREREPLKKQLVDDLYIEGLLLMKPENKIQNIDKLTIFKAPKNLNNIVSPIDSIELFGLQRAPLKKQLVDDLYIERFALMKPENKIQNIDKLSILRTPKPENVIEPKDNLEILPIEREPLKKQLVDDLYIEGFMLMKPENKIQNIDKLMIPRIPRNNKNIAESIESIEILPIEKEPLKVQLVDDLYIERLLSIKPENKIQNIDKLSIFRTPRPENVIEPKDNLEILKKEKEPLKKQLVDDLYIEKLITIKPENTVQEIDKIEILRIPRNNNVMIESRDNIEILPKPKNPLKLQLVDSMSIEGVERPNNEIQSIDKINILKTPKTILNVIEERDNIQLYPKEKEPLTKQLVDDLMIERNIIKPENKIQNVDKMTILKTPKPENIIEEKDNIFISPKIKEPLKNQNIDSLLIEGINRPENKIQEVDKMEILRAPKSTNISIEEKDAFSIPRKEKDPLEKQLVDDLMIEKSIKNYNNIVQNIDKIEILKTPKPENIIEEKDNIFIESKKKDPLKSQVIDSIVIEGIDRPENKIQNVNKIDILRAPKPQNIIIEEKDSLFIPPKIKEPLKDQKIDSIIIEGINRPENKIQDVDKMEILRTIKPANIIIEEKDSLFIPSKEKIPLKSQDIDKITIEGIERPDNKIQNVDKIEILKVIKPKNMMVEEKDSIFIPPKEKALLKQQRCDKLFIEKEPRPENKIQRIDDIEILEAYKSPRNKNKEMIENETIFIPPKEKKPLKNEKVDSIVIEGNDRPENKIQNVDKMEILRTSKPINVIIEEKDSLFIPSKEKIPLKSQIIDKIMIEGIEHPESKIQNVDKVEILRSPKPINIVIEQKDSLFVPNKEKEPLKSQKVDELLVEGKMIIKNNQIQNVDKIEILKSPKPNNLIIEEKDSIFIPHKEKEPLKNQKVDSIEVEGNIRPENNIQNIDKIEILRTSKPKNLLIEEKDSIFIPHKEKEPLKNQKVDSIEVEGNIRPENNIQNIDKIEILRTSKPKNLLIEEKDSIFIPHKEKEPLKNQKVDSIEVEGNIRPENNIQNIDKIEILRTSKPKNLLIEEKDSIFIPHKEKEPLKSQIVDSIEVEGNAKPENSIQNIDKIQILRSSKPKNLLIEEKDSIFIPNKEKEPLKNQKVDSIEVEGSIRPENKIGNIEPIEILRSSKPKNLQIEEKDSIFIPHKEKEPLKNQKVDSIEVEGNIRPENNIQNIDKIEILRTSKPKNLQVEEKDSIFIPHKEKEPLKNQKVDSIEVEGNIRPENKIGNIEPIEILRTPKPENIIEEKDTLFIEGEKKVNEPLKNQLVDSIVVEGINRPENNIQNIDKIEILKTPKPDNKIESKDTIFIEPKEKKPLESKKVDELLIEGSLKPDNQIQNVDKLEILKSSKPKNLLIEEKDSIFIPNKEKEPLKNQKVDSIEVEGNIRPENKIGNIEPIEILRTPKPKNLLIEEKDSIFIPHKEKEPLKNQKVDSIEVEGNIRPENNIQNIDKIEILRTSKPKNLLVEEKDSIFIPHKEKEPLKNQKVDSIEVEGNIRPENKIGNIEPIEILRTTKPINLLIEEKDSIFIPHKEKEPLKNQKVDSIEIEGFNRPENNIQNIDKIEILRTPKPKNLIVEEKDSIFIPHKEKEPLKNETVDSIKVEGNIRPENKIENLEEIEILPEDEKIGKLKSGKRKSENKIEPRDSIFIEPKEKKPLQNQFVNELLIEREEKPQNEIVNIDKIKLLGNPKLRDENKIEQNSMLFIKSNEKAKDPLIKQKVDDIKVEGLERPDNEIQIIEDKMEIQRTPRCRNMIEQMDEIFIGSKPRALLESQFLDDIIIEGIERPQNEIENIDKINILSSNRLKGKNDKNNNIVEEKDSIFIPHKEKEPLEIQVLDYMLVEGIERPENLIQEVNEIKILGDNNKVNRPNNIMESKESIFIPHKEKDPLQKQVIDYMLIEGIERPKNIIEDRDKFDLLRTPRKRNMIEEVNVIKIEPQEKPKENLQSQKVDELKVEGLMPVFSGDKNIPQTTNEIKIISSKIQNNDNDEILSIPKSLESDIKKKEPFVIDKLEITLNGKEKEEEKEEEKDDDSKIVLRKRYSRKTDNIIEGRDRINFVGKEKEKKEEKPLEMNSIYSIYYEKTKKEDKPITIRENEIEKREELQIIHKKKNNIEAHSEEGVNMKNKGYSEDEEEKTPTSKIEKIKEPLIEDKMDDLFIEANKKPINEITIEDKIFIPGNKKEEEKNIPKDKNENEIFYLEDIYIPSTEKKKDEINEEEIIRKYLLKKGKKEINEIKQDDFMIPSSSIGKDKEIKKEEYVTDKMDDLIFDGLERPENTIENTIKLKIIDEPKEKEKPQYEVEYMEDVFFEKTKKKEEIILKKESMDKLSIDGEIKQENKIEKTESMDISRTPRPKNEIKNTEEIFIPSKPTEISTSQPKSKPLLSKTNTEDIFIQGEKKLSKSISIPNNEINKIDPIFIPSEKKEPLLEEEHSNELYIENNKLLKGVKKKNEFEPLMKDNNIIDFYIKGTENQNKALDNVVPQKEKEPLLEDKIENIYFERSPRPKNEIKNVDKILIPSNPPKKIKQSLSSNVINTFYIEGIKKEEEERALPKNEISSIEPIYISPKEKEALKSESVYQLYIENKGKKEEVEIKEENGRVFLNNTKENKEQFMIKGNPKEEVAPLSFSIPKKDNLQENIESITLNGMDRPENEYKKEIEFTILKSEKEKENEEKKENWVNEISPQNNDIFIEGNDDQLELILLRKRNKKIKEEIKPNLENSIFLPGISKSEPESLVNKNLINQPITHFAILGKENKPLIIENKGNFEIDSNRKVKNEPQPNNLIVQGSCFGLLAKPNEPGLETQDIEILLKQKWKNNNIKQKTCELSLDVDNNRPDWNNNIILQKCFKFTIDKTENNVPLNLNIPSNAPYKKLKMVKGIRFELNKKDEEEIIQDDYNYINLEKDDQQKRKVKATITKVYREHSEDDDNQEIDVFSGVSKHSDKKYDKKYNKLLNELKESKNSSNKKDLYEGKAGTVIIKGSNDKKIGKLLFKDMKKSETDERKNVSDLLFKDNNERNSESGNVKYKIKKISRSQVMFKPKEKKTEYLRDYDNEPYIYH